MHSDTQKNTGSAKDWDDFIQLISVGAEHSTSATAIFYSASTGIDAGGTNCRFDLFKEEYATSIKHSKLNYDEGINTGEINTNENGIKSLQKSLAKTGVKEAKFPVAFRPFCQLYCNAEESAFKGIPIWHNTTCIHLNRFDTLQNFFCLSTNTPCDRFFADNVYSLPFYRYTKNATRQDNITDWALLLFNTHYHPNEPSSPVCYAGSPELRDEFRLDIPAFNNITKQDIFYYVYAVLHHPAYCNKYWQNLHQAYPRIPLYHNFHQWAAWGKGLMQLHNGYLTIAPYPLKRTDIKLATPAGANLNTLVKPVLKTDVKEGKIEIDAYTTLSGIPRIAWDYKLVNYSAIEWVLEPFKENATGKSLLGERIQHYTFYTYKEHLINLLQRVCSVSVETMKIINAMP